MEMQRDPELLHLRPILKRFPWHQYSSDPKRLYFKYQTYYCQSSSIHAEFCGPVIEHWPTKTQQ